MKTEPSSRVPEYGEIYKANTAHLVWIVVAQVMLLAAVSYGVAALHMGSEGWEPAAAIGLGIGVLPTNLITLISILGLRKKLRIAMKT